MVAPSGSDAGGGESTSVALVSSTSSGTTAQGARARSSVVPSPTGERNEIGSAPGTTWTACHLAGGDAVDGGA